jgi:hypothetical protein
MDPGSQPYADPDPGQTLMSQRVAFLHEKYTKKVKGRKHTCEGYKSRLEKQETRFVC